MQISGASTLLYTPSVKGRGVEVAKSPPDAATSKQVATAPDAPAGPTKTLAQTAREKINADYAKALKQGTRVVADTANGGRHLDLSSLSDEELASVAKGDGFSGDESLTAKAELAGRMWATLEPFEGNPRASALAVRALYPAMSPAVRDALGWNESMLQSGDAVIGNFGSKATAAEQDSILEKLRKALDAARALNVDRSALGRKSTISLSA